MRALHAALASPTAKGFVVRAIAGALTAMCNLRLGAAVGGAHLYGGLMPLLRGHLAHAVASNKNPGLVDALVEAMGALAEFAGAGVVGADAQAAQGDVSMLLGLLSGDAGGPLARSASPLSATWCTESGEATVHATLARYAGLVGAPFAGALAQIMPALLTAAGVDPDFSISHVEEQAEEEDDDYEVSYMPEPSGKGFVRSRVNVAQTTAKIVALRSIAAYAAAMGGHFLPFLEAAVKGSLPVLAFRFHPLVRAAAAQSLGTCYAIVVRAASEESAPRYARKGSNPGLALL